MTLVLTFPAQEDAYRREGYSSRDRLMLFGEGGHLWTGGGLGSGGSRSGGCLGSRVVFLNDDNDNDHNTCMIFTCKQERISD